jgi:hypothetical protein
MGRLALALFGLTLAVIGALYALDYRFSIPLDEAIRRELRPVATSAELDKNVAAALDKDDIEEAEMYAEIAVYMNRPLASENQHRLRQARTPAAQAVRNAKGFGRGFVTGQGTSMPELAGAVTSDLTVVGDVRDIGIEGGKAAIGLRYDEFILGLSVVGVAATTTTVATGGGGVIVKLGVSVLKVARRAGTLTTEFGGTLLRLLRDSIDAQQLTKVLRATALGNAKATEEAMRFYARGLRDASIFPVLGRLGELGQAAGPGESVRLLKYVRTTRDLDDIADMSKVLGKKTRGVIAFTGKTALRAFKTSLNVLEFLLEQIAALAAWLLGLLGLAATRRVFRRRR